MQNHLLHDISTEEDEVDSQTVLARIIDTGQNLILNQIEQNGNLSDNKTKTENDYSVDIWKQKAKLKQYKEMMKNVEKNTKKKNSDKKIKNS